VSLGATTVDQATIRDEAPTSLADGLRTAAPSVSIQQTTPGQGTIYVRGLSGRAVVYAVDGVRLNMAFFRAGNNDYLGLIDPYAASSVIVVPGAASVEYGSDALGGAVLMNSESPDFRLGDPRSSFRAFQSLTSNPLGTASRVLARREGETLSGQLGFTYYQAGPIRPGEGHRSPDPESYIGLERDVGEAWAPLTQKKQLGTEFEFYAADATLRARLSRRSELVLKVQYAVRPELVRYDQVTPRFKSELPARAQRSLQPMSRAMASATLKHRQNGSVYDRRQQLARKKHVTLPLQLSVSA
jgi:outer membrane receptor protein involved in Fe transport